MFYSENKIKINTYVLSELRISRMSKLYALFILFVRTTTLFNFLSLPSYDNSFFLLKAKEKTFLNVQINSLQKIFKHFCPSTGQPFPSTL